MTEAKKVMLITSVFPPSWGSGVHRVSKLYKYLPDFGYFPIVLTTREDSYGVIDRSTDYSFDQERIIRLSVINWRTFSKKIGIRSPNNNRTLKGPGVGKKSRYGLARLLKNVYALFSIPDDRVLWIPMAIIKGYWMLREHQVKLLYSTSPHHSCHMVALFLNWITGIPWISDFRDPWVENPFPSSQFRVQIWIENILERQVVKYSSKVVSISKPITQELKKRYPEVPSSKFGVLPNSFDPDDFVDLQGSKDTPSKFTISHAGTFYGNRSPEPFLNALTRLLEQRPDWRDYIEVSFIGSMPQIREDLMLLNQLRGVVKFIPYLPYKDMLKFLKRSTILLLIPGPGKGTITGKVFDYLPLRKPILLLSQENTELENILRKTKNGIIVQYGDIERTIECLTMFLQEFFGSGTVKVETNEEEINFFTSMEMTRKLAAIMDELWKKG